MEHGSFEDQSKATFSLTDEDHTLANAVRFTLNQDPRVTFCGYSIPHPSDARVNIRVQTTGEPVSTRHWCGRGCGCGVRVGFGQSDPDTLTEAEKRFGEEKNQFPAT
ncbi:hypothetical protein AABB24_010389 [Solanum stoloniferum]|uniref:DNA-directed RNA polymerase RBP11-like dimerisation domain-containing protein n=1 Tax=Solanum stoloniferum TaxID=62892 RepID=A0ABD2UC55_9SOLN